MKSWASVLLQEKRLHLSQGLSKRMSRPTGTPVALRELPKGCRSTFGEFARRIPPNAPSGQHPPGARASRPHAVPWIAAQFSCDVAARPSCRREPHGPGRRRALAPLPVDPGGGDGRGCGKNCAGGTPALPGGALFHDIVEPKEVYPSSCLFVFIRGSSSLNNPVHPVHPCSISRKPV